ncbi:MAG: hypothetical protein CMJ47_09935 [Planctomyces sp.]|nr:hypothetical protein [Planctomyces sp.]
MQIRASMSQPHINGAAAQMREQRVEHGTYGSCVNSYDASPLSAQNATSQCVDISSAVILEANGMRALAAFVRADDV